MWTTTSVICIAIYYNLTQYFVQFTIHLHYPAGSALPYPFTAILRAHPLSARAPQLRFLVRGQKGSYIKYGVDVQEEQLKALSSSSPGEHSVAVITSDGSRYGLEPEALWGALEHATDPSGSTIVKSIWPSKDAGCYTDLYRNLAEVIRGVEGVEMKVKWEEATAVIEMIKLAKKSAKEGRTIDVPK